MKRLWQTGWRVGLCGLLLVWVFHSIFVNEARLAHDAKAWAKLARAEQWELGWNQGPEALLGTLRLISPWDLALSFLLMGVTVLLGIMRWRLVLRVQGLDLSFGRTAEISLVAHFFNSFLLGSTGGDLMKAYYAARETHHKKTEAVVTVLVDRLIGLWVMLVFAGIMMIPNASMMFSQGRLQALASVSVLLMLVGCTAVVALAFWGGVSRKWSGARDWLRRLPKGDWLERSLDVCRRLGSNRMFLGQAIAISMLLNVVCVLQWIVVGRGLGLAIPAQTMFAVVPMVICLSALPVTPSGLGVRENLFVVMLNNPAIATSALSLSLLAYSGSLIWSLIGGGVYVTLREKHHLKEEELSSDHEETEG